MKKRLGIAFAMLVLAAGVVVAHRLCDGWTAIEIAVKFHSQWGSTNCGHVTNSTYHGENPNPDLAIKCAQNAFEDHRAFHVIFTGYGIDHEISSALVANTNGKAVELFYATGMVTNGHKLRSHRCDFPTRLVVEKGSAFGFPRLHCQDWPPKNLE